MMERVAQAQARARARASELRARIPLLAERLFAGGARRVVLFGSLATGSEPHARTDVDLCVEGMSEIALGDAALEMARLVDAEVDLVRWEDASPGLRRRIGADGVEIARGSG